MGLFYQSRTIPALSVEQAQGSAPLLPANPARAALKIVPPVDLTLTLAADQADGMLAIAGLPKTFVGDETPTNEIYARGGSAGQKVVIWEGVEGKW